MRREKSAAGRGHRIIVVLLLVICLLLATISCALALQLYRRSDPALIGTWRMQLDLTETARVRANAWLRDAELGERVDAGDTLPPIRVSALLTIREDGSWSRHIEENSYQTARAEANRALAASLRELLRLRIAAAGREAGSAEQTEARIVNAIGMSGEQYLADYGPALLPDMDELRALYDGGGVWQISGHRIWLDASAAHFTADESLLALAGEERTEVYERAGN